MEFFKNAKVVRLRSHHDKYLYAHEDGETVTHDKDGNTTNARWTVVFVDHETLRFKSCYGKYLTASSLPFRLGLRGNNCKVLQTEPKRLDSSLIWEPLKEGYQVRLRTPYGQFLCANGGLPPWRNSITHDAPHKTARQDWILWDVDIVEKLSESFTIDDDDSECIQSGLISPQGNSTKGPTKKIKGTKLKKMLLAFLINSEESHLRRTKRGGLVRVEEGL